MPLISPMPAASGFSLPLHTPRVAPTPRAGGPSKKKSVPSRATAGRGLVASVALSDAVLINYYTHTTTVNIAELLAESNVPIHGVAELKKSLAAVLVGPPPPGDMGSAREGADLGAQELSLFKLKECLIELARVHATLLKQVSQEFFLHLLSCKTFF
jgi:hypothetical protein